MRYLIKLTVSHSYYSHIFPPNLFSMLATPQKVKEYVICHPSNQDSCKKSPCSINGLINGLIKEQQLEFL